MANRLYSQRSFTSGEISPLASIRSDSEEYRKGLETGINAKLDTRGGIFKRSGLYADGISLENTKFIEYKYSKEVGQILEFSNTSIRFFNANGLVLTSVGTISTVTRIDSTTVEVTTSGSHGLSGTEKLYISGTISTNGNIDNPLVYYGASIVDADTFRIGASVPASYSYTSGGTISKIYEIVSPYATADLDNIQYQVYQDKIYLVDGTHPPQTLTRVSDSSWSIAPTVFSPEPTIETGYRPSGSISITLGATSGASVTATASAGVFLPADVGRKIVKTGNTAGESTIIGYTSSTVVTVSISTTYSSTTISANDWKLDLSPVCDLIPNGTKVGSVINVRAEYLTGFLGTAVSISGITNANPGVVTANSHGLVDGNKIVIDYVVGMTQVNGHVFTVDVSDSNTFSLLGENTSSYNTYSSGGIVRRDFTGVSIDAFRSADVGRYILINGGVLKIQTVTSASSIECLVMKSLNSTDASGSWTLEQSLWGTATDYPKCVAISGSRLWYANTTLQPTNIKGSEIGNFSSFGIGPDDEDSVDVNLSSEGPVNWLADGLELVIGTLGGEYTLQAGDNGTITPSSIRQVARTFIGSLAQHPAKINNELIFIQGSNSKIRTFSFDAYTNTYSSQDLSYLVSTMPEERIVQVTFSKEPTPIIYAVTEDGQLLVGLYSKDQKIIGWTRYQTEGLVKSVAVLEQTTNDIVYVLVHRNISNNNILGVGGPNWYYVEHFDTGIGIEDLDTFSDCSLLLSDPKAINGIDNTSDKITITTTSAHGLTSGDTVIIKYIEDDIQNFDDRTLPQASSLNNLIYTVRVVDSDTFVLQDVTATDIVSPMNVGSASGFVYKRITTIYGLYHLNGESVTIKADGAVQPNQIVADGSLTLEVPAGEVVVGLPYTMTVKLLEPDLDTGLGSMLGQQFIWTRPLVKVFNSALPVLNGFSVPSREYADLMSIKANLFTGYVEYGSIGYSSDQKQLTFTHDQPLPCNILGVTGTTASGAV